MRDKVLFTGTQLRDMFETALLWLEKSASDIDNLNVFPVPDGDCGTNMTLTMKSALIEAQRATNTSAGAISQAMARGSLLGARGNSGVILCQLFGGIAKGLHNKDSFDGQDFAAALSEGTNLAYKALIDPVEGTILTVARNATEAAQQIATQSSDLVPILEAAVDAARTSVANTPMLLPVLRDAGVVDAGGQGLYIILDGILRHLKGEKILDDYPQVITSSMSQIDRMPPSFSDQKESFGYCTEFVVRGANLDLETIRKELGGTGDCLLVVGDEEIVHIHVHTLDPGSVLRYATSQGTLHEIKIQNMDDQYRQFSQKTSDSVSPDDIATVAVVSGKGLTEVFYEIGATAVVYGGPTMNPSTQELLRVVESLAHYKVIILPNDKNIIPAATQVSTLVNKEIEVVSTETIPQGIAALLAINHEANLKANVASMAEAASQVITIAITQAIKSTKIGEFDIGVGQFMALSDSDLTAVGDIASQVILKALAIQDTQANEVLSIYYGNGTGSNDAEEMARIVKEQYPHLQIDVIYGGQPHYDYIVSLE
ncbi:MAG: DAK2 domain-containing protein [Chloroflexota bacterium]|nr:DAK2 domain-containing protein [Chloroflexota bacterium]